MEDSRRARSASGVWSGVSSEFSSLLLLSSSSRSRADECVFSFCRAGIRRVFYTDEEEDGSIQWYQQSSSFFLSFFPIFPSLLRSISSLNQLYLGFAPTALSLYEEVELSLEHATRGSSPLPSASPLSSLAQTDRPLRSSSAYQSPPQPPPPPPVHPPPTPTPTPPTPPTRLQTRPTNTPPPPLHPGRPRRLGVGRVGISMGRAKRRVEFRRRKGLELGLGVGGSFSAGFRRSSSLFAFCYLFFGFVRIFGTAWGFLLDSWVRFWLYCDSFFLLFLSFVVVVKRKGGKRREGRRRGRGGGELKVLATRRD